MNIESSALSFMGVGGEVRGGGVVGRDVVAYRDSPRR